MSEALLDRRKFLGGTLASTSALLLTAAGSTRAAPKSTSSSPIHGHTDPAFAAVREAFTENFTTRGELGASVCVTIDGKEVLHLWGGYEDLGESRQWQRDTLVAPASSVKGYFPFCIHKLVADGLLDYDHKVSRYWPEFASNGKEDTTVRQLLSHMAGLEQTFPVNVYATPMQELLPVMEAATPAASPGSYGAYHSQTFMPLLAALLYKVTGEEIYTWFRREIAGPWGIDAWISLPQSEAVRAADYVVPPGSTYYAPITKMMGSALAGKPFASPPVHGFLMPYTNARAYARAYGAVASGGTLDGVSLYPESITKAMAETQWNNTDWVRNSEFHTEDGSFGRNLQSGSTGWLKHGIDAPMGGNGNTFGMPGAGGSMGFADPDLKLGFGYTQNSWHEDGHGMGPRYQALVDAVYASL